MNDEKVYLVAGERLTMREMIHRSLNGFRDIIKRAEVVERMQAKNRANRLFAPKITSKDVNDLIHREGVTKKQRPQ